jgi:hypothetical protein
VQQFAEALEALNALKRDGVLDDYAVAGAMALVFWAEPVATYDLDVLVWLSGSHSSTIASLTPIYEWASRHGFVTDAEHVIVKGVPVQFLPAHNALADEAIRTATTLDYEGTPVRVVRPEYLIALYLEPGAATRKRRERAAALAESTAVDQGALTALLERHNLTW